MLDINKLTLGEVAKVEELSGQPISAIGDEAAPQGLTLAALAFVAKRRQDPKYPWNDALSLTFDDATAILGIDGYGEAAEGSDPLDAGSPTPEEKATKATTPRKK